MKRPFRMLQIDILEAKANHKLNQQMQLYSKHPQSKLLSKKVIFPEEFFPPKLTIPHVHHKPRPHPETKKQTHTYTWQEDLE